MTAKQRLLIVEDHAAIRSMLEALFQNAGYDVVASSDGALGLNAAQEGGFAAILLDLKMPQMDGLEFMKHLNQLPPQVPNGPIIIFSSVSYDYAKKRALEAGAADFIVKDDLETIKLVERVEAAIRKANKK